MSFVNKGKQVTVTALLHLIGVDLTISGFSRRFDDRNISCNAEVFDTLFLNVK